MFLKNPFEHMTPAVKDGSERRTMKRRHLIYYLRVWDADSGELLGHVVDITTEGLMLISERPLPAGQVYRLEIRWRQPADALDEAAPEAEEVSEMVEHCLRFRAETLWSSPDINPDFFDTGLRLCDPEETVLEPIQALIESYGFQD